MKKKCLLCGAKKPTQVFYLENSHGYKVSPHCDACRNRVRAEPKSLKTLRALRRHPNADQLSKIKLTSSERLQRDRARGAVSKAVSSGKLKRLACEVCGNTQAQGHHEDYSKPLEVRWLCQLHHTEVHRMKELIALFNVIKKGETGKKSRLVF